MGYRWCMAKQSLICFLCPFADFLRAAVHENLGMWLINNRRMYLLVIYKDLRLMYVLSVWQLFNPLITTSVNRSDQFCSFVQSFIEIVSKHQILVHDWHYAGMTVLPAALRAVFILHFEVVEYGNRIWGHHPVICGATCIKSCVHCVYNLLIMWSQYIIISACEL